MKHLSTVYCIILERRKQPLKEINSNRLEEKGIVPFVLSSHYRMLTHKPT